MGVLQSLIRWVPSASAGSPELAPLQSDRCAGSIRELCNVPMPAESSLSYGTLARGHPPKRGILTALAELLLLVHICTHMLSRDHVVWDEVASLVAPGHFVPRVLDGAEPVDWEGEVSKDWYASRSYLQRRRAIIGFACLPLKDILLAIASGFMDLVHDWCKGLEDCRGAKRERRYLSPECGSV
ncbi:unnamed protein product [Caretta caretta]